MVKGNRAFIPNDKPIIGRALPPKPPVFKPGKPHGSDHREKNYGADINTLIELLEAGKL